jgi:small subunit ribosomal protein S20
VAHHKSALKRIKQNEKRRLRNKHVKSTARSRVRKVRESLAAGGEALQSSLREAVSQLNRAASKGIIPKKRASRLISRLSKAASKAQG